MNRGDPLIINSYFISTVTSLDSPPFKNFTVYLPLLTYFKVGVEGAGAVLLFPVVGGAVATGSLIFKSHFNDLSEIIPGFLVGLVLTIVVSNATSRDSMAHT